VAESGTAHGVPSSVHVHAASTLVLCAAAGIYVVRAAAPVLVPVFVSVLASYALAPFVDALGRFARLPRLAAVVAVYAALAAAGFAAERAVAIEVSAFVHGLPAHIEEVRHALQVRSVRLRPDTTGELRDVQAAVSELQRPVQPPAPPGVRRVVEVPPPFDVAEYLLQLTPGAAGLSVQLGAIAIMTFALLLAGDLFKRKLVTLAGPEWSEKRLTVEVMRSIDAQIERYFVVRILISAIVGGATAAVLWAIGLRNAGAWGIAAGILNVVPFVGPAIAVAAITAAAFLQFHAVGAVAAAAGGATAVAAFEGNILTPWLTSRAGELNTVAVFVAILFWGWMWDVWGMILAVPILVAVKAAADRIEPLQPIGELLGR